jgi:hypothetical protein
VTDQPETFEFESLCQALERAAASAPSAAHDALEIAANALHYLYGTGQFESFREYLRDTEAPVPNGGNPTHTFEDMNQAEQWLRGQSPPQWGTLVKVAGKTWAVGKRTEPRWVLLPSFTPHEVNEAGS